MAPTRRAKPAKSRSPKLTGRANALTRGNGKKVGLKGKPVVPPMKGVASTFERPIGPPVGVAVSGRGGVVARERAGIRVATRENKPRTGVVPTGPFVPRPLAAKGK